MWQWGTLLAQAGETEAGDGGGVVGFIILLFVLGAIWNALTKKKEYDVDVRGRIKER